MHILVSRLLPTIIRSTEEALKTVPDTYREASLGLGATKFQTLYKVILPSAIPGILSGERIIVGSIIIATVNPPDNIEYCNFMLQQRIYHRITHILLKVSLLNILSQILLL